MGRDGVPARSRGGGPTPETRFVRLDDGREVAFRCLSDAPGTTIVFVPGGTTPIEVIDDDAMSARLLRTLGRYGSLVALDRLGIGASDAFDPDRDLFDQLADSFVAVLDDIDAETGWLVAGTVPGPCLLARVMTRHPSRLAGGALLNPTRMGSDALVAGPATLAAMLDRAPSTGEEMLRFSSPSRADDPAFRAYLERAGRLGASAAAAAAYYQALGRGVDRFFAAPGVVSGSKPVLVAHRRDSRVVPLEDVEWWHRYFPGSELVSLEGADLGSEGLDAALLADTIGSFVTGARVEAAEDRPLCALLFVDLVASTERASSAGDAQWRGHLDRYEQLVGSTVDRHGGTIVKHTGDGALATFATASRALSAAAALRSGTRALDVLERHHPTGAARPAAFELLEEALGLEGSDGAEYRAIIATRLGFLRYIAPQWVDDVADVMFGDAAPPGLAQVTADLAIKWGRPNRWLFEQYRSLLRDAVSRGVHHALDHLMIAMLWKITGYSVEENIAFLRQTSALLSDAGEAMGRLLRHDDADEAHIATAVSFWDAANATADADSLAGFGWLAEVEQLDADVWASRTMATLAVTGGRIDWSQKVAERAASLEPTTTTLAIMNSLIRGTSDEWDRRGNIERAVELIRTADELAGTPDYERLRTTLLERGAL